MSARRFSAVVCAALAVTFATSSAALAYSADSAGHSTTDESCTVRGTNGDDPNLAPENPHIHNVICGFGGNDTIHAGNVGDTIYGGPGDDRITGGAGDDIIEGQGGGDTIFGGGGGDQIRGDTSNDTIYANTYSEGPDVDDGAVDTINGGNGNDICVFTDTRDEAINCP